MIIDGDELTYRRLVVLKECAHASHAYLRDLARQKLREFPNEPEYINTPSIGEYV